MKAKKSFLNLCLCGALAAAALSLTGCTSSTTKEALNSQPFGPLTLKTEDYAKAYEDASDELKFNVLVLLTRSKLVSGDIDSALLNIDKLTSLAATAKQRDEATIVYGQYLYKIQNFEKAKSELASVNYRALSKSDATYFYNLYSSVNLELYKKTNNPADMLLAFKSKADVLYNVTKTKDRLTVIDQCLAMLNRLSPAELTQAMASAQSDFDKGFYEYSLVSRSVDSDLQSQVLQDFGSKYPNHPLNELLNPKPSANEETADADNAPAVSDTPADVSSDAVFSFNDGDTIAVLLPLSGRFAQIVGNPAKLGILAALKDRSSRSKVVFYDTNKTNISEIVETIKSNGTKLIIGPILKPEVTALNSSSNKIPSIVLNQPEGVRPVNQWYFDLGPNYEGAIAASKIYADGHKSPVVIGQAGDPASQRAVASFVNTFAKVNSKTAVCSYADASGISIELSSCPISTADSVYVNAPGNDAVIVKTLIPNSIPVYLTDKSYIGINNSAQELALSGAVLGDMPWLLTESALKDSFMQSMPKANAQVQRVFAAAYDSVGFALNIGRLAANRDDVLHGLSGDISLGENGLIETSPMWIKMGKLR